MLSAHPVPAAYRQPLLGPLEPQLKRALIIASCLGALALVIVYLAPAPPVEEKTLEELPERFARLILEEPAPAAPPVALEQTPLAKDPDPVVEQPEAKKPEPRPQPAPQRRVPRREAPKVAQDKGTAGRAKAEAEVTQQLAQVTTSVEKTLQSLSSSLPTATTSTGETAPAPRRRGGRSVRGARRASEVGGVASRSTSGAGALGSGALTGGPVEVGDISDLVVTDAGGNALPSGGGDGSGNATTGRSQASLLATVKRYAPGIRYCYDTALKADPALQGKLVFRLTVGRDGGVQGVKVVEDTLRSRSVVECALAQIETWKFGAAGSEATFQTPFVFRPPK